MAVVGLSRLGSLSMVEIVLRVRLSSGDQTDVTYDAPDADDENEVIEHVLSSLADDAGMLRCRRGERLMVIYARGVAAVEVAPRGAIL